jgi:hypothetical protein
MHHWDVHQKFVQSGGKWHLSRLQSKSDKSIPMRISNPNVNIGGDLRVPQHIYSLHTRYPPHTQRPRPLLPDKVLETDPMKERK